MHGEKKIKGSFKLKDLRRNAIDKFEKIKLNFSKRYRGTFLVGKNLVRCIISIISLPYGLSLGNNDQ